MSSKARPNTVCVWHGTSAIDGRSPVALFISGLVRKSHNPKTGNMLQAWILRADMNPVEAICSAADSAVCGDCKHRGQLDADGILRNRSCYVSVKNAPLSVYRAWQRGNVPTVAIGAIADQLQGRTIRFGAYGDPAAVPVTIWRELSSRCKRATGYTHQWQTASLQGLCMASVDTVAERDAARQLGYRTFRVKAADEGLESGEISCPASDEMGKRTTCEACGLCNGATAADARKTIAINVHGIGTSSFRRVIALTAVS
jgi:hypothetical protein